MVATVSRSFGPGEGEEASKGRPLPIDEKGGEAGDGGVAQPGAAAGHRGDASPSRSRTCSRSPGLSQCFQGGQTDRQA